MSSHPDDQATSAGPYDDLEALGEDRCFELLGTA